MSYAQDLRDGRWQKKRLRIMERDGFTCRDCGSASDLQVHHTVYIPRLKPWDYPDETLLTVCGGCHENRQKIETAIHVAIAKRLAPVKPERLEPLAWRLIESAAAMEVPS